MCSKNDLGKDDIKVEIEQGLEEERSVIKKSDLDLNIIIQTSTEKPCNKQRKSTFSEQMKRLIKENTAKYNLILTQQPVKEPKQALTILPIAIITIKNYQAVVP